MPKTVLYRNGAAQKQCSAWRTWFGIVDSRTYDAWDQFPTTHLGAIVPVAASAISEAAQPVPTASDGRVPRVAIASAQVQLS